MSNTITALFKVSALDRLKNHGIDPIKLGDDLVQEYAEDPANFVECRTYTAPITNTQITLSFEVQEDEEYEEVNIIIS